MATRAETLTGTGKREEAFSDFLDSFAKTPYGNQLGRVTNEQAVVQSIKNLIKTNLGERLFQPDIGSNVNHSLFELNGYLAATQIEFLIRNTINYHEPRCQLLDVSATPSIDDHAMEITIVFTLINSSEPITINFLLKRVR